MTLRGILWIFRFHGPANQFRNDTYRPCMTHIEKLAAKHFLPLSGRAAEATHETVGVSVAYERLLPGVGEKLSAMEARRVAARADLDGQASAFARTAARRGMVLGAAVHLVAMMGAAMCAVFGHDWVAGALAAVPLLSVVAGVLAGRRHGGVWAGGLAGLAAPIGAFAPPDESAAPARLDSVAEGFAALRRDFAQAAATLRGAEAPRG